MNEPIKRVVDAMQQLPDYAQQIMANRFVWEIKEMDWDAIAKQPHSLELAEKLYGEETMPNTSSRELSTEERRTEHAQDIMASIMNKPQKGTKFLQMAGVVEERIQPH